MVAALLSAGSAAPVQVTAATPPAVVQAQSPAAADQLTAALKAGRTSNALGQYAQAETAFRDALELETGPLKSSDQAVGETLLDLALNVSNQGRSDEADALFRRATPLLQSAAGARLRARLATYQAINAGNKGDFVAGLAYARAATELWRALVAERESQAVTADGAGLASGGGDGSAERGEFANALNLQARLELRGDNNLQAYAAASQALLLLDRNTDVPRWWKADSLMALGEVSVAQGRLSAAETYFNAALAIRRQAFGDSAPTIQVLAALGRAYQREGLNDSAIVTYRQVFKLARQLPSTAGVFTADMLVPFATAITAVATTLTDEQQRKGLFAEGFDAFQLVQSPVVDKTIAEAAARLSTDNPALGKLIGEMQDRQREADQAHVKLAYQQSLPDNERSSVEEDQLKAQANAALSSVAADRKTLVAQYPGYEQLAAPKTLPLDVLRSTLRPREGLVAFLIGRDQSFAELVTRDGVTIAPVPIGAAALRETVTVLRRPLEIQGGAIGEFDLAASSQLHQTLLGGLGAAIAGLDHLVVVSSGPLSNLPFGLLVTKPTTGGDYAAAPWLIRSDTLAYTPSLQAFGQLRTAKRVQRARLPLLGFGQPALDGHAGAKAEAGAMAKIGGSCLEGGPMPAALLLALAPLPDTGKELTAVAHALGAPTDAIFLGANATEANLRKQKLDDYRVLYFATHGLLPGELRCQAEPGLVLTPPAIVATSAANDGLLGSSEIASLRLNADLVVLSACNTAAGDNRYGGGEALSGLAEAFFHAGARDMVVTHWQVPSAATTDLMSRMFAGWGAKGGEDVGDALRDAQLALIAQNKTAHPFFWAAFVAIGDGMGRPAAAAGAVSSAAGGAGQ